ncbi:MAG: alpha/beta fold hydrolase [Phycisphaerae bacterium]|nr:alpha/beta fold hydrolase [Phycisphaerae bacterium]
MARSQPKLMPPGMKAGRKEPMDYKPRVAKFEAADGLMIEGDYYPPLVRETESAPLAILIHMYPADRTSWKPLIPGLRKAGFAVMAYDIRGHAGSAEQTGRNVKEGYDNRDPMVFAEAWMDAEAATLYMGKQRCCDARRVAVIGASVGCSIALDYAARDQAVKVVVCLSPGTDYMGLDSVSHIKRCGDRPILLVAPEGEYSAVRELKKEAGEGVKSTKCPGGPEYHGAKMFDAPYGNKVLKRIVKFVTEPCGATGATVSASTKDDKKIAITEAIVGPNGPLAQAIKLFKLHTGSYPGSLNDLMERPKGKKLAEKWSGPYLEDAAGFKDPWGNEFRYVAGSAARHNKGEFDLWSLGPDGKDGTDDDICNWKK